MSRAAPGSWSGILRAACVIALVAPFAIFVIAYVWTYHTLDGLLPALVSGLVQSALLFLEAVLTYPVQGLVFIAISLVIWRVAVPRRCPHRHLLGRCPHR